MVDQQRRWHEEASSRSVADDQEATLEHRDEDFVGCGRYDVRNEIRTLSEIMAPIVEGAL